MNALPVRDEGRYGVMKFGGKYEVYDRQDDFKVLESFKTRRKAENFMKQMEKENVN